MAKKPLYKEELIELYVLGSLPPDEAMAMEARAMNDPDLRAEIDAVRATVEKWAVLDARKPAARVLEGLMAQVDAIEAARHADEPPFLNAGSKAADYVKWTQPAWEEVLGSEEDFYCRRIWKSDDTTTYLVKMCSGIPAETHTDEIERIMILQGECEFMIGEERLAVGPGDQFAIPLYLPHSAVLTGSEPCMFLVQRTKIGG